VSFTGLHTQQQQQQLCPSQGYIHNNNNCVYQVTKNKNNGYNEQNNVYIISSYFIYKLKLPAAEVQAYIKIQVFQAYVVALAPYRGASDDVVK